MEKKATNSLDASKGVRHKLGVVAQRFVNLVKGKQTTFTLNSVSATLSAPKRRLYDVVKILMNLGLCERVRQGTYKWVGVSGMQRAIKAMRAHAASSASLRLRTDANLGNTAARVFMAIVTAKGPLAVEAFSRLLHVEASDQQQDNITRRIYDVLNVLFWTGLASRKDFKYCWTGDSIKADADLGSGGLEIMAVLPSDKAVRERKSAKKRRKGDKNAEAAKRKAQGRVLILRPLKRTAAEDQEVESKKTREAEQPVVQMGVDAITLLPKTEGKLWELF